MMQHPRYLVFGLFDKNVLERALNTESVYLVIHLPFILWSTILPRLIIFKMVLKKSNSMKIPTVPPILPIIFRVGMTKDSSFLINFSGVSKE